jgi:ABC-type nickel/cobalt efflux system permease component RcnA
MPLALSRGQLIALACALLGAAAFLLSLDELAGLWTRTLGFALAMQRDLQHGLAETMRAVQEAPATASWSLTGLGFLYGVFHAVGPGHGKVVITTYLATHESRLARGIALSFLASLLQGITAIVVVGGAALALGRSMRETQHAATLLEAGSYGFVVLLGLYLMWCSGRRLYLRNVSRRAAAGDHPHHAQVEGGHVELGHAHAGCCHAHGPSAADLAAAPSARQFAMTVLSVGLRPCSGSILVLILAAGMHLMLAGTAAVVAISIGTGITVSGLAVLSVYARRTALVLAERLSDEGPRIASVFDVAALMGGILIVLFGVALLEASLMVAQHPLL